MDIFSNQNLPEIESRRGKLVDVRYSDFLKLEYGDSIERVTFSADGTKLLGVNTDSVRVKINSLPQDPDLLTAFTNHKVCFVSIRSCMKLNVFFSSIVWLM